MRFPVTSIVPILGFFLILVLTPTYPKAQDITTIEFRRTLIGTECSSGEVYINGVLESFYVAVPTNPIFSQKDSMYEVNISVTSNVQNNSSEFLFTFRPNTTDATAPTIFVVASNQWLLSFSNNYQYNDRDAIGDSLIVGSVLYNRQCAVSSDNSSQRALYTTNTAIWDYTASRLQDLLVTKAANGTGQAWVYLNNDVSRLIFKSDTNPQRSFYTDPVTQPYCLNPTEAKIDPFRIQKVLGFIQCIVWELPSVAGNIQYVEYVRDLYFVYLSATKPAATVMGFPLGETVKIPIITTTGPLDVKAHVLGTDPWQSLGKFLRVEVLDQN